MLFDLHIHSDASDDSVLTIESIVAQARTIGLDGIAITDHNAISNALKAMEYNSRDFKIIPGIEVSSVDGHILCLGVEEYIDFHQSAKDTIEIAHELGGIAVAAHPYDKLRGGVGDLSFMLDFDAIELNGRNIIGNGRAIQAAEQHNIPLIGASDAHTLQEIGTICTKTDKKDVLKAIKDGKCEIYSRDNELIRKTKTIGNTIKRRTLRKLKRIKR